MISFVAWWIYSIDKKKVMSALKNWRKLIGIVIDNIFFRFFLLLVFGALGLWLGKFTGVQFFCGYLGSGNIKVAEYLATVVVGIPVFILLWCFRTRDVRQQIEKTQAQLWQNHFNNAIVNLTSGNVAQEEIGVNLLMKLFITTQEFNEFIKIAFDSLRDEFERRGLERENIDDIGGETTTDFTIERRKKLDKLVKDWLSLHYPE